MLLKKLGYDGAGAGLRGGSSGADARVVSTIALAPNRSVHVIAIPGGKTLLVGATPTVVNLMAELPPESLPSFPASAPYRRGAKKLESRAA